MKKDKVSIIVPVYNVEKYLNKCINSIINQTYKNIEIIIINDGSTDNSEKIIKEYLKKEDRIIYIRKKNGGLSSARNAGIEVANGEYICFVDSDDWIGPNYIKDNIEAIENNNSDMSICNIVYIYDDGTIKKRTPKIKQSECISAREAIKEELLGKKYKCHAVNKICKLSIYKKNNIRFTENRIYEDVFTMYQVILKCKKISLVNSNTYFYLQNRSGSILAESFNEKRYDIFEAMNNIILNEQIKKYKLEKELQSFYILNIVSLYNYVYPLSKEKIAEIQNKIKTLFNKTITKGYLLNNKLSLSLKIRFFLINKLPKFYCNLMKKIR